MFGNAELFWKPLRASSRFTAVEKSSEVIFVDGFLKATNFHLCWLLIVPPGLLARRSIAKLKITLIGSSMKYDFLAL